MKMLRILPWTAALTLIVAGALWTARPSTVTAAKVPPVAPASDASRDLSRANTILDAMKADYPLLDGVTVVMGTTPDAREAVSYYRDGQIVISTDHTVSIDKIMSHEIWHIIDWRDNGRIDWNEDVPPTNAASYLTRTLNVRP